MPTESESGLIICWAAKSGLAIQGKMTDNKYLTYPGFDVSFLVPHRYDEDKIDQAIAEIKRDVTESATRHLPAGCKLELQDTV